MCTWWLIKYNGDIFSQLVNLTVQKCIDCKAKYGDEIAIELPKHYTLSPLLNVELEKEVYKQTGIKLIISVSQVDYP